MTATNQEYSISRWTSSLKATCVQNATTIPAENGIITSATPPAFYLGSEKTKLKKKESPVVIAATWTEYLLDT
ncbi:hypothetical protein [Nitrospira sp. BLG_2]|uniref:hypothetical protein n=1 Tax=Nitrospira sp. BLG_2 TaxID=3397507 RepID=UPI003B98E5C7